MNIKTQIDVLPDILSLRKWITLCILILTGVALKSQALSYDEPAEGPEAGVIYVTKGTIVFIADPDIKIKQVLISKDRKKVQARSHKKPQSVKSSETKQTAKAERVKATAILYSKNSSSGNDWSAPGGKDIFFVASAGENQIKSVCHRSSDVLYVQNYVYKTSMVSGRWDDLFLDHHFSESHAIRPPPVIV